MIKHGTSHASAVLVSMIAGSLLVDAVKEALDQWSITRNWLDVFCRSSLDWQVDPDLVLKLIVIGGLGFVWGVAFKWAHAEA